ncbi:hypothetical protein ACJJI5_06930 [Microbulbifer sp. EKSA008]|uniref:hypothetical protein n=1 Tax=unclassified Microbulbifer TaxID=2619833 RepID=UPI001268E1ED|nr:MULTISPECIES: hypothetical protein [unclassified Microbulbifer]WHI48252.1 hypothetical protein P0078_07725 [Microbulbifer sp. VAAF005]
MFRALQQPGESIHSFILRVFIKAGFRNINSLIAGGGGWREYPSIPDTAKKYFTFYPEKVLIDIFDSTYSIGTEDTFSRNRFTHFKGFPQILNYSHGQFTGKRIPIKFCKRCIEEKLANQGHAFFESKWLYISYCEKHNCPLWQIKRTPSVKNKIKSVILGVLSANWEKVSSSIKHLTSEVYNNKHYEDPISKWKLYFSPCAKLTYIEYFVQTLSYQKNYIGKFSDRRSAEPTKSDLNLLRARLKRYCHMSFYDVYSKELQSNYKIIKNFEKENFETIKVKRWGMEFPILKDKKGACASCSRWNIDSFTDCSISGVIASSRESDYSRMEINSNNYIDFTKRCAITWLNIQRYEFRKKYGYKHPLGLPAPLNQ